MICYSFVFIFCHQSIAKLWIYLEAHVKFAEYGETDKLYAKLNVLKAVSYLDF